MCGIFGIALKKKAKVKQQDHQRLLKKLYQFSESRGKESAGLYTLIPAQEEGTVLKGRLAATDFIASDAYKHHMKAFYASLFHAEKARTQNASIVLAHSRLVTDGCSKHASNNQPIQSGDITAIHNGIIVNADKLWDKHSHLQRSAEVDTEVAVARLDDCIKQGMSEQAAMEQVFSELQGSASLAWTHKQSDKLMLATNTGDLYYVLLPDHQGLIFASEHYILEKALTGFKQLLSQAPLASQIQCLSAYTGLVFHLSAAKEPAFFNLSRETCYSANMDVLGSADIHVNHYGATFLNYNETAIRELTRCSRCILPETFPFIEFDEQGECNYCKHYKPHYLGTDAVQAKQNFIDSLQKYKKGPGAFDVIVPFSGGRDSSYGLHLICKEFNLNPVTFTYDWGMVTDLARRNIARMCGQLGVQNILVSANVATKRRNIRKNVAAWLTKPNIGMVPLFMAGDKSFFKIVNQLKRQTGIDLNLWCANPLENTDFKSGFCGVRPDFDKRRLDYLSLANKVKLASYYGTQFVKNRKYINTSLIDSLGAFGAYYFEKRRDFYFMFNHFAWDETVVNDCLLSTYDWEVSPDSSSTWRIGDGVAPFYNYIYNTLYGFSEFDTFRSNQIREGMITREVALEAVYVENRPRGASLAWYLDTIGLDFNETIQRINQLSMFPC